MNMVFKTRQVTPSCDAEFIGRLKKIYAAMDEAYRRTAQSYGFDCDGCQDTCCRSRFYHHTAVEHAYLLEGLKTLSTEKQREVKSRAMDVVVRTSGCEAGKEPIRLMCPLNFNAHCILYPYRPMICRLHGLPHELKKPGQKTLFGPGCQTFDHRCGHKSYIRFDRTPFYREMAGLEQEVRQKLGIEGKLRITVAEMILADANGTAPGAQCPVHT
jgi:Fe-S-cluster containining protein